MNEVDRWIRRTVKAKVEVLQCECEGLSSEMKDLPVDSYNYATRDYRHAVLTLLIAIYSRLLPQARTKR